MSAPRILLYDLETSPMLGYVWSRWQEGVIAIKEEWSILCVTWKWLDEKQVHYIGVNDFPKTFKNNPQDDSKVVQKLHSLFDEADIIIAHNGDKFDRKKSNTGFILNGFNPPSPYQTIDTLKVARWNFAFSSNKLDDLGEFLGCGRKVKHPGFEMWLGCLSGDEHSWDLMKKYAIQDTKLLEKVYKKLIPWCDRHPNMTLYNSKSECPKCGKRSLHRRGERKLVTGTYARFQCMDCGGWCRSRKQEATAIRPSVVN